MHIRSKSGRNVVRIAAIISGALVLALLIALIYTNEPRYQGRALSEWLAELNDQQPGPEHEAAIIAVGHIGTNGLPVILKELRAKDSPIKLKFVEFLAKHKVVQWHHTPAHTRQRRAVLACQILGPGAKPAIPELVRITQSGDTGYSITALRCIGDEAVPSMLQCLVHTNNICRSMTAFAFREMPPRKADLVIPALIKALEDPYYGVRNGAIVSLREYRAKAAIPALKQTAEQHPDQAELVSSALKEIESPDVVEEK